MRVIAGLAKGHKLMSLKGYNTRPTLDRVREAVFNVLGSKVFDSVFLDLFAGTGAIGIESLSRGAKLCYFNDKDKKAKALIEKNLTQCRLQENGRVYSMDALQFIRYLQEQAIRFDLVYLDPPYKKDMYETVLNQLGESDILAHDALIVVETGSKEELSREYIRLTLVRATRYGDTIIWYYQYN